MSASPARLSRRRFIAVSAAAASLGPVQSLSARTHHSTWKGVALGAEAQIQLSHPSEAEARAMLKACVAEIDRLENIFSLYRPQSTLSRLNATGLVIAPELEFIELLSASQSFSRQTGGAFDVTVQPLWELHRHRAPSQREIAEVLQRVGYQHIKLSSGMVSLARPGMKLTLNGIAQGYITDRIAKFLKRRGFENVLVHLGETYGAGAKPGGVPWKAAIEGTEKTLTLKNRALATSGDLESSGQKHLFDPRTGHPSSTHKSVSVTAPTATTADALSSAFILMEKQEIARVLSIHQGSSVTLVSA